MQTKQNKRKMRKSRRQPGKTGIDTESAIVRSVRATGSVFPIRWKRVLRYVEPVVKMTSTTGSIVYYQFMVNSLYDPNYTGTGHQPRFFDQICSGSGPYRSYRVLGGRVTLEVSGDNGVSADVLAVGFSELATIPSDLSAGELPGWRTLLVHKVYANPRKVEFSFRVADILGVTPSAVSSEAAYAAPYNSSPSTPAYFSMMYQNTDAGNSTTYVVTTIEFDVQFEDPLLVAAS